VSCEAIPEEIGGTTPPSNPPVLQPAAPAVDVKPVEPQAPPPAVKPALAPMKSAPIAPVEKVLLEKQTF